MLVLSTAAVLLFSLTGLSPIRLKAKNKSLVTSTQMLAGLFLLTSIFSLLSIIGFINQQALTAMILSGFVISFGFEISRRKKEFWMLLSKGSKLTIFLSLSISSFLEIISYKKLMTYMNPDPYGYMALSGGLMKYGSINEIMSRWSEFTGQVYTQGLNWDLPTKLLPNAWLVPDMVIRYAVDEIVNGRRIGFSSLLVPGMQFFEPISFFLVSWLALGIFGMALIAGAVYDLVLTEESGLKEHIPLYETSELALRRNGKGGRLSNPKSPKPKRDFRYLWIIALTISPIWALVFLFEGLSSQLCTAAAMVTIFGACHNLQGKSYKKSKFDLFIVFIIFIGTYFIYVQQLPMILLSAISPFLIQFLVKTRIRIWMKLSALILLVAVGYVSLRFTSLKTYFDLIIGSSGHGAIHLGSVNPIRAQFSGIDFFWTSISPTLHSQELLFRNFLNSGLGIPVSQHGYTVLNSSFLDQVLSIFVALLISVSAMVYLQRQKTSKLLTASVIPFAIWSLFLVYYLVSHVYSVFEFAMNAPGNESNSGPAGFSDYIWLRLIAVFSIYFLIVISLILSQVDLVGLRNRIYVSFGLVILVLSGYSFIEVSSKFQESSTPGSVITSCKEVSSYINPIYVYQPVQGSQAVLAITLCGENLNSFSDPFPSKLKADGKRHDVIDLIFDQDSKSWALLNRGSFTMTQDIQTPCDYACIKRLPDFQQK